MKKLRTILLPLFATLCLTLQAQGLGIPFFKAFDARVYRAHTRNFDIECDSTGRVFVANFEGLLVYNGYQWITFHTPGTSRITTVYKAHDGRIWFGGPSVLGYYNDRDSTTFITDEKNQNLTFNEVKRIYEQQGKIQFNTADNQHYSVDGNQIKKVGTVPEAEVKQMRIDGDLVVDQLTVASRGYSYYGMSSQGLIVRSIDGSKTYHVTRANLLPSNSINALAYDGCGTVWGATDNGLFCISTTMGVTYYYKSEGIDGMVNCLFQQGQRLLIGTQQGLLVLQDGQISPVQGINHTCWAMQEMSNHDVLIATADGLFVYRGGALKQLSDKHTISLCILDNNTLLTGELDGVYRRTLQGEVELVDQIPNVSKFKRDKDGTLWLINLDNATYRMKTGEHHFVRAENKNLDNLFEYYDDKGIRWSSLDNGQGLQCSNTDPVFQKYLEAFANTIPSAMYIYNGTAWLGTSTSVIRWDLKECCTIKQIKPDLYIRQFIQNGRRLTCAVSNNVYDMTGQNLYSYRLHDDDEWSHWERKQELDFPDLSPGRYQLQIRSRDIYGQIAQAREIDFEIPYPWYLRWYTAILYILVVVLMMWGFFHWRLMRMHRDKEHLEAVVNERTRDLREAQKQLLRKEKEATVGKLTKGLIDRILNPMNYINNFSHLTLGLVKDLRQDVEDEQENMSEDNYEDCEDVLDMMNQNLEKIEQHGLATTRILKAMEEMLKDRSGKVENMNLTALCNSDIERLNTYFKEDIQRMHIQIEWQKPMEPVMADVNADLFSRTMMSMLSNSMYYLAKKVEKGNLPAGYVPTLRLTLDPRTPGSTLNIHIWDNGLGIEESIQDKVFDPFFTTKPTNEASGVGLYLSQQIIQDLGGNISVQSTKGEFTEFIITLP